MADKARTSFPISVDFYEGELPSAAKMNGLAKQAKQGLSLIEYAIGDMWNQSGDAFLSSLSDAPLMIPNIARTIGAPKHLNPRIPNLPNIQSYTHTFTDDDSQEVQLDFPVHSSSSGNFVWTGSSNSNTPESSKLAVNASGKWYLNYQTGTIYSFDGFSSSVTLTYQPGYYDESGTEQYGIHGDIAENADYNMVPDPRTPVSYNFRSVKIEKVTGLEDTYDIYLPPRMPLQSSSQLDFSPDYLTNFEATPDSVHDRKFFQSETADACISDDTNAKHYRYNLPRLLTESVQWQSNTLLPNGFMYLYDQYGTGTVIEGLQYYVDNNAAKRTWVFRVVGANLTTWLNTTQGQSQYPTVRLESSSHAPDYYPPNGLKLITVGTDLSTAFSSLLKQYLNHDHNSQGSFASRQLSHANMMGLFDISDFDPTFTPSLLYDDHPQYLHRFGWDNTGGRDKSNAMLGHLVLADYNKNLDLNTNTYSLSFGNNNGASLYWDSSEYGLRLDLPDISGSVEGSLKLSSKSHSTEFGRNTSLTVGRIYPGSDYDTEYHYSGVASDGWGPIRSYHIHASKFLYLTNGSSGYDWPASSTNQVYADHPYFDVVRFSEMPQGLFGKLSMNSSSGAQDQSVAYAFITLPYSEYAIVNFSSQFRSTVWSMDTWDFGVRASYGHQNISDFGNYSRNFRDLSYAIEDYYTTPPTFVNVYGAHMPLFTVSTTSPLMTIEQTSAHVPWFSFSVNSLAFGDEWFGFSGVTVSYRIKEW